VIKTDWIVYETSGLWAATLRLALDRDGIFRLREASNLEQLSPMLQQWPMSLVGLEICDDNLAEMLSWISDANRRYPFARFVAFVDPSRQQEIESVLREAGVLEITSSPRRLGPILGLARRHAAEVATRIAAQRATESLEEQLGNGL